MKIIGNDTKQIGGGDTGQEAQGTSSSTGGWKTPWWVFRLIKLLYDINPLFARIFGLMLGVVVWLFSFIRTTIDTIFKAIVWLFSFIWTIIRTASELLARILSNKKLVVGCLVVWGGFYLFNKSWDVNIPLYAIIGPPLIATIGLITLVIWRSNWKPSLPDTKGFKKFRKDIWDNGRLLPILVCVFLIHVAIYKIAPEFWLNNICNWWSLGLQVALGVAVSVKPEDPKKPGKYKLSTVATILLSITLLIHIGGVSVEGGVTKVTTWWETNLNREKALRTTPVTSTGGLTYPHDEHWPDKDIAEQILEGQWDLLAACFRESGLRQFGVDGKPLVNQNKNGLGIVTSIDTGICQLNSVHDAELTRLGLDKNKLEDNLRFAKILYEKEGLKPWNAKPGQKLTFQVPVSEEGTNTFKRPQNVYTLFNNKESVHIALNNERWTTILEADPGFTDFTPAGTILDYKFRLLPGKTDSAWVTVTYTYQ